MEQCACSWTPQWKLWKSLAWNPQPSTQTNFDEGRASSSFQCTFASGSSKVFEGQNPSKSLLVLGRPGSQPSTS
eukprot:7395457-Pyramimonas_sp.AAC.1